MKTVALVGNVVEVICVTHCVRTKFRIVYLTRCRDYQCDFLEPGPSTGGGIQIKNKASDLCLDLRYGGQENGGILELYPCTKANNQRFDPVTARDAHGESLMTFTLRHSSKCLESNGNNENIDQWTCDGGYNQKWVFYPQSGTVSNFFS